MVASRALQKLLDIAGAMEHRNYRERPALGVIGDEIRIDAPELQWPIREVLARVTDAGCFCEFPDGFVDCLPDADCSRFTFVRQIIKNRGSAKVS
jgi:hypothetical protein